MAFQLKWYAKALANLMGGESGGDAFAVDYLSDTIKLALLDNGHTPALDTHEVFSDVEADEIAGTGYTAGGTTLGSKTLTVTPANSWGVQWQVATAYAVGDVVRPTAGNGHLYMCIVAGTSHASTQPTWPTVAGQVVTDNGVTWAEVGRAITQIDAADPSWASSTLTARYCAGYKSTGTSSTSPLLFLGDFGSDQTTNNGTFAVTFASLGILVSFVSP
jgi:hypothetical protein